MASYYRRKNGTYCIRVSNGKPGGKQELVSTTYKPPQGLSASAAEKGAKEFAELFEAAVHNGMFTPGRKQRVEQINPFGVTLSDFIEQHYYKRIEMRLSPNTVRFYTSVIEQCILPSFGKLRLCDISSAHLQALIDYLATSGSRADESQSEPLSASTVKRYATVFSSVMTEAFKMGLVEKDVLHKQYIEYPKIYKKQIQAYDDDEAKTFFEGLSNEHPKVRALLLTSLLLGLRRGEVVGLMWNDIDFKNNCLTVNRSAYKVKGQPQAVKMPKSKNSIRTVYFPEIYAEVLREWMEIQDRDRRVAGRGWKEQGFVFTNEVGNMINIYLLSELCSKYEEKCGLRHLKLHGLRHTCGSLMIKNGVDIETVKSVFGHESIRTTQQYLSSYDSAKRSAAEILAKTIIK
jgi:integrase